MQRQGSHRTSCGWAEKSITTGPLDDDLRLAYRIAREMIGQNVKVEWKYYDRAVHLVRYKEGDQVMLKYYTPKIRGHRKLVDKWAGPYYILDVLSDINFNFILNEHTKPKVVHHDRFKRHHRRDGAPDVSWVLARSRSFKEGGEEPHLPAKESTAFKEAVKDFVKPKTSRQRCTTPKL